MPLAAAASVRACSPPCTLCSALSALPRSAGSGPPAHMQQGLGLCKQCAACLMRYALAYCTLVALQHCPLCGASLPPGSPSALIAAALLRRQFPSWRAVLCHCTAGPCQYVMYLLPTFPPPPPLAACPLYLFPGSPARFKLLPGGPPPVRCTSCQRLHRSCSRSSPVAFAWHYSPVAPASPPAGPPPIFHRRTACPPTKMIVK